MPKLHLTRHPQQTQREQEPVQAERTGQTQNRLPEPLVYLGSTREERRRADTITENIRNSAVALLPKNAVPDVFAYESNEQKSAGKRKRSYHRWGSSLNRKRQNFHEVKDRQNSRAQELDERMKRFREAETETPQGQLLHSLFAGGVTRDAEGQEHFVTPEYREALAEYLDEKTADRLKGDETGDDLLDIAVEQFLGMDLKVDIRTDKSFAANAGRIEEIIGKTDAMLRLLHLNPGYEARMLKNEESKARMEELFGRLKYANMLSRYCKVQRMIITNKIYRTHFRSEIGLSFREEKDSREEGKLKILIWMAERLRMELQLGSKAQRGWFGQQAIYDNPVEQEYVRQRDERGSQGTAEQEAQWRSRINNMEGAKNDAAIEDGVHADYFRAHNKPEDPIFKALAAPYSIAGDYQRDEQGALVTERREILEKDENGRTVRDERNRPVVKEVRTVAVMRKNTEEFSRKFAAFRRWRAVQEMPEDELNEMLLNLAKKPASQIEEGASVEAVNAWMQDHADEIAECRQANIKGLMAMKNMYKKHVMYLRRKYGDNLPFITDREQAEHAQELTADFTDFQAVGAFIRYLKSAGLFYSEDESDGLISDSEFETESGYFDYMEKLPRGVRKGVPLNDYSTWRRAFAGTMGTTAQPFADGDMKVNGTEDRFNRVLMGLAESETETETADGSGIDWNCPFNW